MTLLPRRRLGSSDLDVSVMSLGSWRTFERIPREQGVAVMGAARTAGINFLDDARYDDDTGSAPLPTGYSEVVFGELFRAAGWVRDEVVVANKLWWEHWPDEDAATELDGSLARMGLDHVDLIYAVRPPAGLPMEVLVEQVDGLVRSGRARAWGTGMWSAAQHHEALGICRANGVVPPAAAQMADSLVDHAQPDDPEMRRAFDAGPIGLVASYVLAGGTLTGKYLGSADGRAADDDSPVVVRGKSLAPRVVALADEWEVPPAHVAFVHAFLHPNLASIVFGARSAEQLTSNVAAHATFTALTEEQLDAVRVLADG
jgi:aryl-alcohol dehydrogenase-like predicted oxidoreductase